MSIKNKPLLKKIVLGSVQFGEKYGISNVSGQTSIHQVYKILDYALINSINTIDTAPSYGGSEEIIGNILNDKWKIITKTKYSNGEVEFEEIVSNFNESLKKLKVDSVHGLLVHNGDQLLGKNGELIFSAMKKLKDLGVVDKIGVSVYDSIQIKKIINKFEIDIIQLPFNIFDQRLLKDGTLHDLKNKNIEIHARSIFLQGLLLMDIKSIPAYFNPILDTLKKYHTEARYLSMTNLEFALSFVNSVKEIDCLVIGVETLKHLEDMTNSSFLDLDVEKFKSLAIYDKKFINPSNWSL
jgi:aryl-alcohol dehydrogenase-like predicted oxidoreductase